MAKPELGTKRTCANCGNKFYDLKRDPIICPACGTVFEVVVQKPRASAPKPAAPAPAPAAVAPAEDEDDVEAVEEKAELVPLETADEEVADTGTVVIDDDADDDGDDVIKDDDDDDDDDTFLAEDDEEDDDVADIIGDVDDEEEH